MAKIFQVMISVPDNTTEKGIQSRIEKEHEGLVEVHVLEVKEVRLRTGSKSGRQPSVMESIRPLALQVGGA